MKLLESSRTKDILSSIKESTKEPVKVKLYDEWQEYPSVEEAKADMLEAMSFCDPMSAEYHRYAYVFQQLMQGETICYDDINDVMELEESVKLEESNKLDLYSMFNKKEYEAEGKTFDDICKECAQEIIDGVETAEVKEIETDPDGASVYIVTNNGFGAWFDFYIGKMSTEVEGDLPENVLEGDWNAYIFHTEDPSDMITKYVQEDADVFMIMEDTGYNYLIENGYIEETPIKRTNGMEASHYEWTGKKGSNKVVKEAENPENKLINNLIRGLLLGQTKAKQKLEKMGYTVEFDNEAYKQWGKDSFGKYVTITNNKTGKKIVGSYGSRWGHHDFISAKPVEDNSASSDPVKKQQWQNSFHRFEVGDTVGQNLADPNKFDYKGYLDKETPDLSEPESEFQRFKRDKAYLKDKEYEAKRIDAARDRVAKVRARLGKEPEEDLKEGTKTQDFLNKLDADNTAMRLAGITGDTMTFDQYTKYQDYLQDIKKKDTSRYDITIEYWDRNGYPKDKSYVGRSLKQIADKFVKARDMYDFNEISDYSDNLYDLVNSSECSDIEEYLERIANGETPEQLKLEESLKEEVIDVEYIGRDDWDRHIVKDPKTGRFYGDVNLTTVGKDKDFSTASWHTYSGNNPYEGEPEMPVGDDIKFNIVNPEEIPSDYQRFEYGLLSRLESDCKYFLGNGNGYEGDLWAGSVDKQIAKMRELYNQLEEKPEWITLEDINNYEKQMKEFVPNKEE